MLNTSYKRIQQRIAALKAEADVSTGKPSKGKGAGARGGEQIAGNLYRGQTGQFQAGPAGQLRQRIEAIREMRKQRGKKPKGKGKGKAPKPTPEQLAAQREQEIAKNRADTFSALGMPEDAVGALDDLLAGTPTDDDGGLVKLGLAEVGTDGTLRLTAQGRAVSTAASQGDLGKAKDAASRARDAIAKGAEKEKAKADKENAKQEKEKASSSSGGGKQKEKAKAKEKEAEPKDKTAQSATNRATVAEKMMANDVGVTAKGLEAMAGLSSGEGMPDEETVDQLTEMGLVEKAKDGTPRLTTQGRAAVRAAEKGDYGTTVDAISRAADAVATRKEKEAELAALEEEAPSDEELVSEAAATVGLEDQDVEDLRSAADEGGAANEALQAAGLVDKDGAATAEGVDALEALERGDVRGYRRAARKARARVRREKGKQAKDKAARDREVSEEVSRIDEARGRGGPDRGRGIIRPGATKAQVQAQKALLGYIKHGKHDQSTHGRSTARRAGARAAYSAARSAGASVAEARAEANSVSTIHRQKQRMANIERQLEGEISERQRSSLQAEHDRLKEDTQTRLAKMRDPEQANALGAQVPEPTVRGRYGALHDYDQRLSVSRARYQETQNRLADAKRDLAYKEDAAARAQNAGSSIRRMHEKERNAAQREVRRLETQSKDYERAIARNEKLYEGELARPQMTQRRAEIMGERAYLQAYRDGKPHHEAVRAREEATARVLEGGKPKGRGDALPQNLSETTPKQRRALVDEHAQMPPTELRRRLLLNRDQLQSAYEQQRRAAPGSVEAERLQRGVDNLMFRQGIIMAAQDRQDKPKARNPRR